MYLVTVNSRIAQAIRDASLSTFQPHFGELDDKFKTHPCWSHLRHLGTDLWLDTGNIGDARKHWRREFSALTTNNTLLNKEVQGGDYDSLIISGDAILSDFKEVDDETRILEIAFLLNARHALRLVQRFDATVSVELHTNLAHDVSATVAHARRFHEICPERFLVKIPFTPAGVLAARRLSLAKDRVPVNFTLGFSARQNYVIATIAQPEYVNVFLGRLNAFAKENHFGDGEYVGEKATLASQRAIRDLRTEQKTATRQIGASLRSGQQIANLAGVDVLTIPVKVAEDFLNVSADPSHIIDRSAADYHPVFDEDEDIEAVRFDTLWEIDQELIDCVDALQKENLDSFTPDNLIDFFRDHDCADVFVRWTQDQIDASAAEGKIPEFQHWDDLLESRQIGLDSLMSLAGLNSFSADQSKMDRHVDDVLEKR